MRLEVAAEKAGLLERPQKAHATANLRMHRMVVSTPHGQRRQRLDEKTLGHGRVPVQL
jgi:hypothetical protein